MPKPTASATANTIPSSPAPECQPPQPTPEAASYIAEAHAEFKAKQRAAKQEWRFEDFERWGFDQLTGTFRLEFADRKELHADGQILGSYSESAGTWEWAWHNPYVSPAIARDSQLVRETGQRLGLACTASDVVQSADEKFIAECCALGLKTTGSLAIFRGSAGPVEVLILIKSPRIVEKAAKASRKKAA